MGCTARGGDSIHLKKRLLALIAAAAVLVISAVAIVSLNGDDKPEITNDVPGENEQPASTPQTAYRPVIEEKEFDHKYVVPAAGSGSEGGSDDSADDADDGSDAGDNDDTGSSDDQSGSDSDDGAPGNSGDDKKHGLERALEVHEINLAKKQAQVEEKGLSDNGNGDGHGLENSLEHLQENLAKHTAADAGAELDHGNNGHGQAKGN